MIRFPAVDCALEGFRLTRERPRTVAVWGVILFASAILTSALSVGSGLQPALLALQAATQTGDTVAVNAQFAAVSARAPALVLILLIGLATNVVVYTALLRAILRPETHRRSFHLQFGPDEARQLAVAALLLVLLLAAVALASTVAALIDVLVASALPGAAAFIRALSTLVVIGALVYPAVRLSITAAATFDARRIQLREAWRIAGGQFWGMAGAFVLALVMAFLVWLLFIIVVGALLLAALEIAGLGIKDLGVWLSPDPSSLAALFSLHSLVALELQGAITTLVYVIVMSPAPAIYRALGGAPTVG